MVLLQFLGVNVQLYFNARLGLLFQRYLGHQFLSAGCLLALAFLAKLGVDHLPALHGKILPAFLLAGFCYSLLFGLKRQDLQILWKQAKH